MALYFRAALIGLACGVLSPGDTPRALIATVALIVAFDLTERS